MNGLLRALLFAVSRQERMYFADELRVEGRPVVVLQLATAGNMGHVVDMFGPLFVGRIGFFQVFQGVTV